MRQVGYFYPALDLSSGADEAPFIIHTQPADETESSLFLRSHNVPPCVLLQRRNQDPGWQYTRDSLRSNSVLASGRSIDYSSVFGLLVLFIFFPPEYFAFVCGFAALVQIKFGDIEDMWKNVSIYLMLHSHNSAGVLSIFTFSSPSHSQDKWRPVPLRVT